MVWRVTTSALTSLQRSACCRCAASNCQQCCPGLVSSQYLISIKCTCRWLTFSWWGCLTRLAVEEVEREEVVLLPAALWRSAFIKEPGRGHNMLVDLLKRTVCHAAVLLVIEGACAVL
eukprot:1161103-Pelagomonas_calceolata.AAC.11